MPTRQQVLEGLRVVSEEIMTSLRILLTMIFSMTTAIQPEENVSEADVAPINQLISEVKSQKEKIAELGNIISSQFLNPKTRSMGPQPASPTSHAGTDLWELAEMEEEERSLAMQTASLPVQNINLHGLGPSISPSTTSVTPMTPPRNPVAAGKVSKIAGSPICGAPSGQAASAAAGVNDQNALAWTNTALEQWGAKLITWGKKHTGKTFRQTFEGDPGYVRWCQARSGSLHEDIADFLNYAITRQRLQTMAQQVNHM
jgi:hypothetical protein